MADMLIRGQDPADIALGDTLADDKHPDERFDYQLSNPPYGVEWKPAQDAVEREHAKGGAGRFGPGLPRISDGQMLFQLNALSKMRPFINGAGGGKIGLVHNGSPLFTGDAGGGESEIRRYILEHDYLDAIVALPTDMFYNTNIATYLWFMTNRKPQERRDKVMLIDASNMGVVMKKNLGKKRFELSADCQHRIITAYHDFKPMEWADKRANSARTRALKAKILPTSHFFYRKVTIERPLRMRFDLTADRVLTFGEDTAQRKLKDDGLLLATVNHIVEESGPQIYTSAGFFREALQHSANAVATAAGEKPSKLKSKQLEVARKFFGVKDKSAEIATNEKDEVLPDSDLRDAEFISFSTISNVEDVASGIQSYFDAEVKPHWPDAWVNTEAKDKADDQIGLVGCEINFNREFYVYQAPRGREAIRKDIEAMERRFMEMLQGVVG